MNNKKILVLGATGAMAVYLIPLLLKKGYKVVGVALEEATSDNENLTYIKSHVKEPGFLDELLKQKFDAIVDFVIYNNVEDYKRYYELYIKNTSHYIYFSTYRVYADDSPLHEGSKRLLDVEKPDDFITDVEYSIYKAEEEDFINNSEYDHYTIVRPAITFSKRRFQLTTLEANVVVYRMLMGKTVVLPEGAMDKQATMSWAGDVAKMLSCIILNPKAFRETYNVSTAEHMTWAEVAKIYEEIGGLKYVTVDNETYVNIVAEGSYVARQQLLYDRCFNRVVDNTKILELCGMKQEDLTPLKEGLKLEYENVTLEKIGCNEAINKRMDEYLEKINVK